METWEAGAPFRETLRAHAAAAGVKLDEARLDEVMRPGALRRPARRPVFEPTSAALVVTPAWPCSRRLGKALRELVGTPSGDDRVTPASGKVGTVRGRRAAARRRQRPDLRVRPRAADADPGQGRGADRAVASGGSSSWPTSCRTTWSSVDDPGDPGRRGGAGRCWCRRLDDAAGRVRRPRLPDRLRAGRLPRDRRGLRRPAAARAGGRVAGCPSRSSRRPPRRRSASTTRR